MAHNGPLGAGMAYLAGLAPEFYGAYGSTGGYAAWLIGAGMANLARNSLGSTGLGADMTGASPAHANEATEVS